SVRRVILPDLNDELAKNVGPYETLADLKDDVRTRLAAQMKERNREQTKQNLIGKLLELHQFPMPESLVTSRFEYLSSLQESQFKRYGISQDTLGENREKIDKANRERAERQTRLSVILADVVERESLILTDDEFDERLEKVAHESGYEPDGFANYVFRKGLDNYYKDLFIEDKALEFLLDKVTLTSSEATTPDSETPDSQTESTSKEAEA
ncbi:MAG TPA: hypothetical protein PKH07_17375, partial [bacterium]|nr:hypothetical protein [bacterium]